jgi:ADP-ribose pyrophosphatase YjhB (NUDIX family)
MTTRHRREVYTAAIIERSDSHLLIALPKEQEDSSRLWQFPRGPADRRETPEAAMRRIAKEKLGVTVEIVSGQPPIVWETNAREVELRYFFCSVSTGEAKPGPYAEVLWIPKAHLREYDFDPASKPVAEWLLTQ